MYVFVRRLYMSTPCERRASLEKALAEQGLVIRKDSALCSCYIDGTLDSSYTPEAIAHLCGLHKYLYEYTDYSARCACILPAIANGLSSSLGSYEAAWKYVVQSEAPLIKMRVLQEFGVPLVWPWLNEGRSASTSEASSETDSRHERQEQPTQQSIACGD